MDWFNPDAETFSAPPSRRKPETGWTQPKLARAAALGAEGCSAEYIAGVLSIEFGEPLTRNAVIGKMHRAGITFGTPRLSGVPKPKELTRRRTGRTHSDALNRIAALKAEAVSSPKLPKLKPVRAGFLGITIMELTDTTCRYPRGEQPPFLYCGQPTKEDSSWCVHCHAVTHQKPSQSAEERGAQLREIGRRYQAAVKDTAP